MMKRRLIFVMQITKNTVKPHLQSGNHHETVPQNHRQI